jgi:hypothetical protein
MCSNWRLWAKVETQHSHPNSRLFDSVFGWAGFAWTRTRHGRRSCSPSGMWVGAPKASPPSLLLHRPRAIWPTHLLPPPSSQWLPQLKHLTLMPPHTHRCHGVEEAEGDGVLTPPHTHTPTWPLHIEADMGLPTNLFGFKLCQHFIERVGVGLKHCRRLKCYGVHYEACRWKCSKISLLVQFIPF